ncbi:acyltransferase family protein [Breznakiella homolactica]|uniref:Acyltransferase n=1 Tax=Breznakiella homolactica TaxID=2798577 RepID=A0A7T8B9H2_9SPIR|nr:acyltransferase [Breznakiella homolactica]QQO08447.1 acyltransferase [Breznakiella homolactica]
MNTDTRKYYLDWLRVITVALLVPHHAAITFSHIGDAYVLTREPVNSLYFFIQSTFLNLWFMRLLFFISGIAAFYGLRKRSHREFLTERVKRLLVPTLFGVALLCPASAYMLAKNTYGFTGSLLQFYPVFFSNFEKYLGWGHFWFLAYLFVYSVILIGIRKYCGGTCSRYRERMGRLLSAGNGIFLPMAAVVFLEMVFRPFYPGRQNLYADWANVTVYLLFFLAGYAFGSREDFLEAVTKKIGGFGLLGGISAGCYIVLAYIQWRSPQYAGRIHTAGYGYAAFSAFFRGIAEYSLVMVCVGTARKYLNRRGPVFSYLTKTSFALYIFHFVLLSLIMYFLIGIPANPFLLYGIAAAGTYLLFILVFELIVKRISPLRFICGIKSDPPEQQKKPPQRTAPEDLSHEKA